MNYKDMKIAQIIKILYINKYAQFIAYLANACNNI